MFACDGGCSAVVAELLSHGADVELRIFEVFRHPLLFLNDA